MGSTWFVLTEAELQEIEEGHPDVADSLRERGKWTDDGTLLVKPKGPESVVLAGCYSKLPRRIAIDPPTNTLPSDLL
jgi:hypothetical protein